MVVLVFGMGLALAPIACLSSAPSAAAQTPPAIALLTTVTAQDMGTFDRVAFTFEHGTPQIVSADYATGLALFSPSGNPVVPPIAGRARLVITMANAADEDLTASPVLVTYPGPLRFTAGLPNVTELVQLQDFEARLTWAIGVNDSAVTATARVVGATRVEVDIPHPVTPIVVAPAFTG
jgi:hypothetical protein